MLSYIKKIINKNKNIYSYNHLKNEFIKLIELGLPYSKINAKLSNYITNDSSYRCKVYRACFSAIKDVYTHEAIEIGEKVIALEDNPEFVKVLANRYRKVQNYSRYDELIRSLGEEYTAEQKLSDIKKTINDIAKDKLSESVITIKIDELLGHFPEYENVINELVFSVLKDKNMELAVKYGEKFLINSPDNLKFAKVLNKRLIILGHKEKASNLTLGSQIIDLSNAKLKTGKEINHKAFKRELKKLVEKGQKDEVIKFIKDALNNSLLSRHQLLKSSFTILKEQYSEEAINFGLQYISLVPNDNDFNKVFKKRCLSLGKVSALKEMHRITKKNLESKSVLEKIFKRLLKRAPVFDPVSFKNELSELNFSSELVLSNFIDSHLKAFGDNQNKIHEISFSVLKDSHPILAIQYGRIFAEHFPQKTAFVKVFVRRLLRHNFHTEALYFAEKSLQCSFDDELNGIVFKNKISVELEKASKLYAEDNLKQLENLITRLELKHADNLLYLYSALHKFYLDKDNEIAIKFGEKSLGLGQNISVMRSLYDLHLSAGNITKALSAIPMDVEDKTLLKKRINGESFKKLLLNGFQLPERKTETQYEPIKRKVFYLLHNRLPYNSGGYATRSHGLLTETKKFGWDMNGVSRLGYPSDKMSEKESQSLDVIDSIPYHTMLNGEVGLGKLPLNEYLLEYAKELESLLLKEKPECIHAASNYMNGVVANYVARRLGIKSIYEIRGLWEITRISRQPEWKHSEYYNMMCKMEAEAAKNADHVFTLTLSLKNEMVKRGVDESKISLLPNGVDSSRFAPRERNIKIAEELSVENNVVIGFIGSVVEYEGLDYLVEAVSLLVENNITNFIVIIVGDGSAWQAVKEMVAIKKLTKKIIFTGRVPHEQVEQYYSLVDIAPFPRKGIPVCEMVSALKPFEAMSMEKAIVASDVAAMKEFVFDGENGVLFRKDDPKDLALKLEKLIKDKSKRKLLGKQARQWVIKNRDWKVITETLNKVYKNILQY